MIDRYDALCAEVRRILFDAREPDLSCRPEDIVILPGRKPGMLTTPSAIAMVPSRRSDPGKFAGAWADRANTASTGFGFAASRTGHMDIAVSHDRILSFLRKGEWLREPLGDRLTDPEDRLFFVWFLRSRLHSFSPDRLTDETLPESAAFELDWHLLRGAHVISRGRTALAAEWACTARDLFESYFAGGEALSSLRIAALDSLLAAVCRKTVQKQ